MEVGQRRLFVANKAIDVQSNRGLAGVHYPIPQRPAIDKIGFKRRLLLLDLVICQQGWLQQRRRLVLDDRDIMRRQQASADPHHHEADEEAEPGEANANDEST